MIFLSCTHNNNDVRARYCIAAECSFSMSMLQPAGTYHYADGNA